MGEHIKTLHSYWAYFVLAILLVAIVNAIIGLTAKKNYLAKDFRIALFTLIVSHLQLLIGLVLYFVSDRFALWSELGGGVMKNSLARLYLVEHPLVNILAIVCITIGFSKHKNKVEPGAKFKTIFIWYLIGLILLLSRIPYHIWPNW